MLVTCNSLLEAGFVLGLSLARKISAIIKCGGRELH